MTSPITKVARITPYETVMLVLYSAISPDAIRYGHTHGTNGAQF